MATAFSLTLAYLGEAFTARAAAGAFAAYITGNVASNFIGRLISAGWRIISGCGPISWALRCSTSPAPRWRCVTLAPPPLFGRRTRNARRSLAIWQAASAEPGPARRLRHRVLHPVCLPGHLHLRQLRPDRAALRHRSDDAWRHLLRFPAGDLHDPAGRQPGRAHRPDPRVAGRLWGSRRLACRCCSRRLSVRAGRAGAGRRRHVPGAGDRHRHRRRRGHAASGPRPAACTSPPTTSAACWARQFLARSISISAGPAASPAWRWRCSPRRHSPLCCGRNHYRAPQAACLIHRISSHPDGDGHERHRNARRNPSASALRRRLGQIVLVLQGGGALGAYQVGVYQALHEAGIEPDWVVGTSIGAINASLIAGNPVERRMERLNANSGPASSTLAGRIRSAHAARHRQHDGQLDDHGRRPERLLRAEPDGLRRPAHPAWLRSRRLLPHRAAARHADPAGRFRRRCGKATAG